MAANHLGFPNHVQVGINDTPLTQALEKGDFRAAEKLIEENIEASYLDEGPFEKIPLALVLTSEIECRIFPRHLRLAKLLVEQGANPNLRIPQAEWQGASASPLELLLKLYDLTTNLCKGVDNNESGENTLADPMFTIGLHDETELSPNDLEVQLLELIDVFLACGGNPNVTTTTSNSTLYHIVVAQPEPNIDLVMKLCEAGGDLNQTNVHGTTPLMDLITYADGDLAIDILHNIWLKKPDISSLQNENCSDETALWRAMLAGSPRVAISLLHQGASPIPCATITLGRWHRSCESCEYFISRGVRKGVSAILAPLLQDSSTYVKHTTVYTKTKFDVQKPPQTFHVNLLDKVFSAVISPVVDTIPVSECFPKMVLNEIDSIVYDVSKFSFENFVSAAVTPQDVMMLIFGKLTAGLQQLCVRQILQQVFFVQDPSKALGRIQKLKDKKLCEKEENTSENGCGNENKKDVNETMKSNNVKVEDMNNITHWDIVMELDSKVIDKLVKQLLKLPPSLVTRFEIEATRLQLGASLYNFESVDCVLGCDGESDEGNSVSFEDDFNDIDEDEDDDDDDSNWYGGFMTSEDCSVDYVNSDTDCDLESVKILNFFEDNTSSDNVSNCSGSYDEEDLNDEGGNDENLMVYEDASAESENEGMDVENANDMFGNSAESDDGMDEDVVHFEYCNNSSSSGECVPENICRDNYETFGDDSHLDDTLSSNSTNDLD